MDVFRFGKNGETKKTGKISPLNGTKRSNRTGYVAANTPPPRCARCTDGATGKPELVNPLNLQGSRTRESLWTHRQKSRNNKTLARDGADGMTAVRKFSKRDAEYSSRHSGCVSQWSMVGCSSPNGRYPSVRSVPVVPLCSTTVGNPRTPDWRAI